VLGWRLSPHGGVRAFRRKGASQTAREPGRSFTLSSALADSAGRCSPKITLAQETVSSPFPPSRWGPSPCPVAAPGCGHGSDVPVPVPTAPSGLVPGLQQPWEKPPARSHGDLLGAVPGPRAPALALLGGTRRGAGEAQREPLLSPAFVFPAPQLSKPCSGGVCAMGAGGLG